MKLQQLIKQMTSTYQVENRVTILEHGQMVREKLWDLLNLMEGKESKHQWCLPKDFFNYKDFFLSQMPSRSDLYLYTVMHDCGKPACKHIDEKG